MTVSTIVGAAKINYTVWLRKAKNYFADAEISKWPIKTCVCNTEK